MFGMDEESMEQEIGKVLSAGTKFQHEYDYGSTIELKLRVVAVYKGQAYPPGIVLLARNQAPTWKCATCGMPAMQLQATGWG